MENSLSHTLVMLPGLDGTGLLFSYFIDQFQDRSRIIVVEYPRDELLDYDQLADVVHSQLPKSGQFILIAESFAGPIAARLIDHPQLSAIIFCASFLTSPQPLLLEVMTPMPLSLLVHLPLPSFPLRLACFGFTCPEAVLDSFRATIQLVKPEVIEYRLQLLLNVDDLWRIRTSPVPLGYLKASDDRLVPASNQVEIKQTFHPLITREIAGPHFLLQVVPDVAKTAILKLCSSLKPRSS